MVLRDMINQSKGNIENDMKMGVRVLWISSFRFVQDLKDAVTLKPNTDRDCCRAMRMPKRSARALTFKVGTLPSASAVMLRGTNADN